MLKFASYVLIVYFASPAGLSSLRNLSATVPKLESRIRASIKLLSGDIIRESTLVFIRTLRNSPRSLKMPTSTHMATALFTSLAHDARPWRLRRMLESANCNDLRGKLDGTTTFTPLMSHKDNPKPEPELTDALVYREEGIMHVGLAPGLPPVQFSRHYAWKLDGGVEAMDDNGDEKTLSVWFVKLGVQPVQIDYLFHRLELQLLDRDANLAGVPIPAGPVGGDEDQRATCIILATGGHPCVNDYYRTVYTFRMEVSNDSLGELVSWASRHVVEGPNKAQVITNWYER